MLIRICSIGLHKSTIAARNFCIMQCNMQCVKRDLRAFFDASVRAVQPNSLLRESFTVEGDILKVKDRHYKLNNNCYVVGFGKAVLTMAFEAERILGKHLVTGIISVPEGILNTVKDNPNLQLVSNSVLKVSEGAKNNLPDKAACETASAIKDMVQSLGKNDLLIVLISGGGSALLPLPVPPITLEEKKYVVKLLAAAGANIQELNCVRKKLSVLKGGGLAEIAFPAQVVSLILSDVVGDPLDMIASGPTVLNQDAYDAALNIVKKFSLLEKVPLSVQKCLKSEDLSLQGQHKLQENKIYSHVQNVLIGSNSTAVAHAAEQAASFGYSPVILSTCVEGNISDVGNIYTALALSICESIYNKNIDNKIHHILQDMKQKFPINESALEELRSAIQNLQKKGLCLIAGGETTVVVRGNGIGGRNQELAMIFTRLMYENSKMFSMLDHFEVVFLSAGTDGIDGPTNAAGAFGYRQQFTAAMEQTLDPNEYEKNNDSFNFYNAFSGGNDLIITGHTCTNVMDVHMLIIKPIETEMGKGIK
ncbi:Glycerate kinase [Blattella germanica]|nr:Glycerate kinase [Blattella germanica]